MREKRDNRKRVSRSPRRDDRSSSPKRGGAKPFRGLNPALPTLWYKPGINNAANVDAFLDALRPYVRSKYSADVDDVVDKANPRNPEVEPAGFDAQLAETSGEDIANRMFEHDMKRDSKRREEIAGDLKKLHGEILGQLANSSKEQLRTTAEGVAALEGKDPLTLVIQIRATHLQATRNAPELNYQAALRSYTNCRCQDDQPLDSYRRQLESVVATLGDAIERLPEGYGAQQPGDRAVAAKFIEGLPRRFGAYKRKVQRREKEIPETLEAAYDDVVLFGEEYVPDDRRREDRRYPAYAANGNRDKGKGRGRDRGDDRRGHDRDDGEERISRRDRDEGRDGGGSSGRDEAPVPGTDGQLMPRIRCNFRKCNKYGHMMAKCPLREEYQRNKNLRDDPAAIDRALNSARQGN